MLIKHTSSEEVFKRLHRLSPQGREEAQGLISQSKYTQ